MRHDYILRLKAKRVIVILQQNVCKKFHKEFFVDYIFEAYQLDQLDLLYVELFEFVESSLSVLILAYSFRREMSYYH